MRIVLVRPRDPNNIGAAARAMANFGFGELVVVAPYAPVWREAKSAVGAGEVMATAREVATLDEAIADCELVGATTAGTRRRAERIRTLEAFATEACGSGVACLVFGNEKHGLAADEIARCHVAVRIETDRRQPSLNLGHAVAIACYEIARGRVDAAPQVAARRDTAAAAGEVEALVLAAFPIARSARVEARRRAGRARLRALLLAARATRADVALLRGILHSTERESDNDPAA